MSEHARGRAQGRPLRSRERAAAPWRTLSGSCWNRILPTQAHVHVFGLRPGPEILQSSPVQSKQIFLGSFYQTIYLALQICIRLSSSKLGLTVMCFVLFVCLVFFALLWLDALAFELWPFFCSCSDLWPLLWNKHWRVDPRGCSLKRKRPFRRLLDGVLAESKSQNAKCLQFLSVSCHVCSFFFFLPRLVQFDGINAGRDNRGLSRVELSLLVFQEAASHTNASPIFALEVPFRGHCSHASEVHVCRGTSPHPRVTSADFLTLIYLWNPSYLS